MIKRVFHTFVAAMALTLGIVTHAIIQEVIDGQITAQSVAFMMSHALIMASVVWQHARLAVKGLKFQSPILTTPGG